MPFVLFACLFALTLFSAEKNPSPRLSHYILVSVSPHKFFVDKIAGATVKTGVMVPAGASIHTYEPTPKEMLAASTADAWFLIGEAFEKKAIEALKTHHPEMELVDLKEGVDLIQSQCQCRHAHNHQGSHKGADLHMWLSPKEAKVQAQHIAQELMQLYPENKALYENNLKVFLDELTALDLQVAALLKPLKNRIILVSHPAYGYLCRDYGLDQVSIEFEGKDPTPQQLTKLLDTAKKNKINTVFIQRQYNNKGARLIADYLGAKIVNLDPYSENYLESVLTIAKQFAAQEACQ